MGKLNPSLAAYFNSALPGLAWQPGRAGGRSQQALLVASFREGGFGPAALGL